VLAVGQHADIDLLNTVPGVAISRGGVVEVDGAMSTGHRGIFAGGDLIGGRTITEAVGHGKKAARNIDAFLRLAVYEAPEKHPLVPFEALNLPVFLSAARQQAPEVPVAKRKGFEETAMGLTESQARYEAQRCLSCGNCFLCDNCQAACPEQAIIKLAADRGYRVDYDLCSGCAVCFEQCPCHAIEMIPEPSGEIAAGLSGEPTSPPRFEVRP
jgi:Pyruvate/2-oxoacid:ferredoxin oxidoreductase delta subunit